MVFNKGTKECDYCTQCGSVVQSYSKSTQHQESYYTCPSCDKKLLAQRTDSADTGKLCRKCGGFWLFDANYCGYCGQNLHGEYFGTINERQRSEMLEEYFKLASFVQAYDSYFLTKYPGLLESYADQSMVNKAQQRWRRIMFWPHVMFPHILFVVLSLCLIAIRIVGMVRGG